MFDLFDLLDPPKTLRLRVTTRAKSEKIKRDVQSDGQVIFRVYVTCEPVNGKANHAIIKLLASHLGIPKSHITILHGQTSRDKIVQITP